MRPAQNHVPRPPSLDERDVALQASEMLREPLRERQERHVRVVHRFRPRQRRPRWDGHGVVGRSQVEIGSGVYRAEIVRHRAGLRVVRGGYLLCLKRYEVRIDRDVEERVAFAVNRYVHRVEDALPFQRVQIDGRRRHEQRGYHYAREYAGHEPPLRPQPTRREPDDVYILGCVRRGQAGYSPLSDGARLASVSPVYQPPPAGVYISTERSALNP